MLKILGNPVGNFCDRVSRRTFLQIGGLALGGVSLPQILRADAARGVGHSQKSVIMIYLPGGPPHQDMFDLKTDAPAEIRGEFKPIKTSVPGIEICELLPGMARIMDKLVPIRSLVGSEGTHESFQCFTGRWTLKQPPGGWPELGSIVARLKGPAAPGITPYVNLAPPMAHAQYSIGRPGFLGPAYAPFQPNGEGKADMTLQGVTLERLGDRRQLIAAVDQFKRRADASSTMDGVDAFQQQAFDLLTSSKLLTALNLEHEDPRVRERYGHGTPQPLADGGPRLLEQFLLARRLVEAGVRCVTLAYSWWDFHLNNFGQTRENLPLLDRAVTALVEDLHERGLADDVTVIVWGEFGRTPKINPQAGRDHWPNVMCALMAGGRLRTGQVIGSTDRLGGEAKDRPVTFPEVFATLYHRLGIDPNAVTVPDLAGRPQYLVERAEPLKELI